jgi:hypothetical protein
VNVQNLAIFDGNVSATSESSDCGISSGYSHTVMHTCNMAIFGGDISGIGSTAVGIDVYVAQSHNALRSLNDPDAV